MTRYCAGIDLGTTNTVLAVWLHGKDRPSIVNIRQPVDDLTPDHLQPLPFLDSVVTLLNGRVYVGKFARQLASVRGAQTFTSIKRFMGRHWFRTHRGVGWTPERVSACILKVVREQLLSDMGAMPERVVVTIPASFGTEARRATLAAAHLAGFNPTTVSLFDEPTAALLAELRAPQKSVSMSPRDLHAVVDIGGGTLDVSLVRLQRDKGRTLFDIIGQSRYNEIAGDDFDLNIAGLLLHRFEQTFGPISRLFEQATERVLLCWLLLQQAREVKHRLSDVLGGVPAKKWSTVCESATIAEFPDLPHWRTEVSGSDLVAALHEFFSTVDTPDASPAESPFFRPIQECLNSASVHEGRPLGPRDVAYVWMAGGSSYLPPVKLALEHLFGRPPILMRDPMNAVATGAAWKAGLDERYGDGRFDVRERVFDGVFLKTSSELYYPVVPARQRLPMEPTEHHNLIEMPQHDSRLVLELYVGARQGEDEAFAGLSPLARRIVTFPEILPRGTRISLIVSLSSDRQLSLELTAHVGRPVRGVVAVGTAPGWDEMGTGVGLPPINELGGTP